MTKSISITKRLKDLPAIAFYAPIVRSRTLSFAAGGVKRPSIAM
jgi:hypothetical protein